MIKQSKSFYQIEIAREAWFRATTLRRSRFFSRCFGFSSLSLFAFISLRSFCACLKSNLSRDHFRKMPHTFQQVLAFLFACFPRLQLFYSSDSLLPTFPCALFSASEKALIMICPSTHDHTCFVVSIRLASSSSFASSSLRCSKCNSANRFISFSSLSSLKISYHGTWFILCHFVGMVYMIWSHMDHKI